MRVSVLICATMVLFIAAAPQVSAQDRDDEGSRRMSEMRLCNTMTRYNDSGPTFAREIQAGFKSKTDLLGKAESEGRPLTDDEQKQVIRLDREIVGYKTAATRFRIFHMQSSCGYSTSRVFLR